MDTFAYFEHIFTVSSIKMQHLCDYVNLRKQFVMFLAPSRADAPYKPEQPPRFAGEAVPVRPAWRDIFYAVTGTPLRPIRQR